ncbi:MAG: hypothetical protein JKY48_09900 [Flavobacteriales bacterium]|nr:hypothetical protein [Flavobacteriales bacterium]
MADSFFKRLAEDLLHLEVNTIIKSQMTGQKMPDSYRRTLYEIAHTYSISLIDIGKELVPSGNEVFGSGDGFRGEVNWEYGGLGSFEELKNRAKFAIEWIDQQPNTAFQKDPDAVKRDKKMLERVQDNSHRILGIFFRLAKNPSVLQEHLANQKTDQKTNVNELIESIKNRKAKSIKDDSGKTQRVINDSDLSTASWNNDIDAGDINDLLNDGNDLKLDLREIMMIKKAWDIGVEEIMLQTIVGIDGDVTTRILERFAKDPDKTVLDLHNEGLKTSINFWYRMVDTVTTIVGSAIGTLLSGKDEKDKAE